MNPARDDFASLMKAAMAPERITAQQAADAAMVEIQERPYVSGDPPLVVVCADWLRAFLTNFFDEWLTEIGGEQARGFGKGEEKPSSEGDPTSPPATPIDTEDLRLKISMAARDFALQEYMAAMRGAEMIGPDHFDQELREILDTALTQSVEVCEVQQQQDGMWTTACGVDQLLGSPTEQCKKVCPWCGKPIREVSYCENSPRSVKRRNAEEPSLKIGDRREVVERLKPIVYELVMRTGHGCMDDDADPDLALENMLEVAQRSLDNWLAEQEAEDEQ